MIKKIIRIGFIIFAIAILYYSLNKGGYVPPIGYFLPFKAKSGFFLLSRDRELSSTQETLLNYQLPIREIISSPINKSQTAILIEKSRFRLTIYYQNKPIKSYPVVFGSNDTGDKLREGDMKTP